MRTGLLVAVGLVVTLGLAVLVSPWADPSPDGLERVAEDTGIAETGRDHPLGAGPLADYGVAGVEDEGLATGLSGLVGVVVTLLVAFAVLGLARRLGDRSTRDEEAGTAAER